MKKYIAVFGLMATMVAAMNVPSFRFHTMSEEQGSRIIGVTLTEGVIVYDGPNGKEYYITGKQLKQLVEAYSSAHK